MSLAPSIAVPRTGFNPLPLYIGLFCLLWSFAFVAGKIGVTDCPPLILLTARFSLAGILILGISALRDEKWQITWRDAAVFAILGVANNALYLGLGYTGLKTVSAGLGGLIVSANPVFTAVLAALFLGESLTWRKVAGLLLGISGVGFIVWHRMSVGTDSLHGILFTLASLASIVVGTILFKVLAPKGSLWIGNGVQNLAGGLALLPFALTFSSVSDIVPSARLLGAFAFLVLGGSILAYLLWFHLLKVCGATAASAYHFLMPPLGMLFAWMVLGEHVETRDLLGIIPVAFGIYLVTRPAAVAEVRRPGLILPEHDRGHPAGHQRHERGGEPVDKTVLAGGGRDELLEADLDDFEAGDGLRHQRAIGEQFDLDVIASDRHLRGQRNFGAEQRRRQERHR